MTLYQQSGKHPLFVISQSSEREVVEAPPMEQLLQTRTYEAMAH